MLDYLIYKFIKFNEYLNKIKIEKHTQKEETQKIIKLKIEEEFAKRNLIYTVYHYQYKVKESCIAFCEGYIRYAYPLNGDLRWDHTYVFKKLSKQYNIYHNKYDLFNMLERLDLLLEIEKIKGSKFIKNIYRINLLSNNGLRKYIMKE